MSFEEYMKEKLWSLLIETVHALIMFPNHKAYTKEIILNEKPNITPAELAVRLKMTLGEALVILYELKTEEDTKP